VEKHRIRIYFANPSFFHSHIYFLLNIWKYVPHLTPQRGFPDFVKVLCMHVCVCGLCGGSVFACVYMCVGCVCVCGLCGGSVFACVCICGVCVCVCVLCPPSGNHSSFSATQLHFLLLLITVHYEFPYFSLLNICYVDQVLILNKALYL
jgi:hypothetical protein